MAQEIALADTTEAEHKFITNLLENGGNIRQAARDAGYADSYAYFLKKRLSKAIVEATTEYLAMNGPRAANRVVSSIDDEMPHPVKLQAAFGLLDRIGVVKKTPEEERQVVKQNIFILPAKQNVIDLIENNGIFETNT